MINLKRREEKKSVSFACSNKKIKKNDCFVSVVKRRRIKSKFCSAATAAHIQIHTKVIWV